jgi:hypothetical protein
MLSGSAPFSLTRREKERRAEWAARVEEAGSMIIGLLRQRQSNPVKHPRCAIAAIKVEVQLQGMTNRCMRSGGCSLPGLPGDRLQIPPKATSGRRLTTPAEFHANTFPMTNHEAKEKVLFGTALQCQTLAIGCPFGHLCKNRPRALHYSGF